MQLQPQSQPKGAIFEGCLSKKETTSTINKKKNDNDKERWEKLFEGMTGAALCQLG